MLTLAGEKADIVGINLALTAGVIDERRRNATEDETDRKVAWVRDGAGERFDALELQTRIQGLTMVTDDGSRWPPNSVRCGLNGEQTLASLYTLVGTTQQLIDESSAGETDGA